MQFTAPRCVTGACKNRETEFFQKNKAGPMPCFNLLKFSAGHLLNFLVLEWLQLSRRRLFLPQTWTALARTAIVPFGNCHCQQKHYQQFTLSYQHATRLARI